LAGKPVLLHITASQLADQREKVMLAVDLLSSHLCVWDEQNPHTTRIINVQWSFL